MSSRSGSTAASAYPAAAAIRPQLASDPKIAVFTRLSRAIVRATVTASSSVAAPVTRTVIRLVTPSASACICCARSRQTAVSAAVNTSGSGATPEAPEASTSTVSLVDIQPSTSSRSKLTRTAARSASSRTGAVDDGVRGEHGEHGGHRGSDHPGALGGAADAPPGLVGVRGLLRDGVRGHDRGGGGQPGGGVGAERGRGGLHPGEHGRPRELLADQPGGTDRDLDRAAAEDLGGLLGGGVRGLETLRPRARVRTAGVEDDRPQPAGDEHLLRPQHRRRLDLVAGEHPGGGDPRGRRSRPGRGRARRWT